MHFAQYPTQEQLLTDIVDLRNLFPHRIIVAGSRGFEDYPCFSRSMKQYVEQLGVPAEHILFYTGMCPSGADSLIIRWALEHNYRYYPFPADWDRSPRGAGMIRNREMARDATALIAFYDGTSRGTADMIKVMEQKKRPVEIIDIKALTEHRIVHLYTIQMAQWRVAKALGIKLVDITAKSGVKAFAPDMETVQAYKAGHVPEDEYTRLYLDRMFVSRERFPKIWNHLKAYNEMAFACYCTPGHFCHRHIFINLAQEYLERHYIDVEIRGELTPASLKGIQDDHKRAAYRDRVSGA